MESDWEYQRWYVVIHRGCHKGCIHMLCHSFVKLWNWVASQLAWRQYRFHFSPSLSLSAHPTEAFSSHSWKDRTTNVALIGSHHLHAVLSFFSFQLRLLFIFFRCSCRDGFEIPEANISRMWSQLGFLAGKAGSTLEGFFLLFSFCLFRFEALELNIIKTYLWSQSRSTVPRSGAIIWCFVLRRRVLI